MSSTISELIDNIFAFMSWWHIFLVPLTDDLNLVRVFFFFFLIDPQKH